MIHQLAKSLAVCTALTMAFAQQGDAQKLTFEGLGNWESVLGFYDGGSGSYGNSGTNYGIEFLYGAIARIDSDIGGTGSFENNPSGYTALFGSYYLPTTMNVFGGFSNGFTMSYSSVLQGQARVYSGLNGTGLLLGTINLSAQNNLNCPEFGTGRSGDFCNWSIASLGFAGTAQSVQILTTNNQVYFDDMSFGEYVLGGDGGGGGGGGPENIVQPEPITTILLGTGLAGLAAARKRRRGAQIEEEEA